MVGVPAPVPRNPEKTALHAHVILAAAVAFPLTPQDLVR